MGKGWRNQFPPILVHQFLTPTGIPTWNPRDGDSRGLPCSGIPGKLRESSNTGLVVPICLTPTHPTVPLHSTMNVLPSKALSSNLQHLFYCRWQKNKNTHTSNFLFLHSKLQIDFVITLFFNNSVNVISFVDYNFNLTSPSRVYSNPRRAPFITSIILQFSKSSLFLRGQYTTPIFENTRSTSVSPTGKAKYFHATARMCWMCVFSLQKSEMFVVRSGLEEWNDSYDKKCPFKPTFYPFTKNSCSSLPVVESLKPNSEHPVFELVIKAVEIQS